MYLVKRVIGPQHEMMQYLAKYVNKYFSYIVGARLESRTAFPRHLIKKRRSHDAILALTQKSAIVTSGQSLCFS